MSNYRVEILNAGAPIAGWEGTATDEDDALRQAKDAHPGVAHLEADVELVS